MMRTALLLACLVIAAPLSAQTPQPQPAPPRVEPPARQTPPAEQPRERRPQQQRGDEVAPGPTPQERGAEAPFATRARLLDDLFARLRAAPDARDADGIDDAIEAIWARTGSPTVDLLMSWAAQEMQARNMPRALDLLDGILALDPDHAEAYHRRGQIHGAQRNYDAALADLERAIRLEPRHYVALTSYGTLMRDLQNDARALQAFRAALRVHPHFEPARRLERLLAPRVDGREG